MDGHQAKEKPPTNQGHAEHVVHEDGDFTITKAFIDTAEDEEEGCCSQVGNKGACSTP